MLKSATAPRRTRPGTRRFGLDADEIREVTEVLAVDGSVLGFLFHETDDQLAGVAEPEPGCRPEDREYVGTALVGNSLARMALIEDVVAFGPVRVAA